MMYYYWTEKGIRPSVFYNIPEREKLVIRAFYEYEQSEKRDSRNRIKNKEIPIFPVTII